MTDEIHYTLAHAGKPGHNEYGVPFHACNGYRHDEHYWAWVVRRGKVQP